MNIVIAPSGFKESLDAREVADCIEIGIRRVLPDANIIKAPLVDGGEGFACALAEATKGTIEKVKVTGPVGEPVEAHFAVLGGDCDKRTMVLEMSAAAGLRLVPHHLRDPLATTTYGVGELISATLDAGAERILLGCGDSGTNDGGVGMAQALGVRLLDSGGQELERGGSALRKLARIDTSKRDPRLEAVQIDVACNWHNVLCGDCGVARVFGPQKGASPQTVDELAGALDQFAEVIQLDLGLDVREMPGGGASGGLGAGLHAFLGATLHPRYDIVMQYLQLDSLLAGADLVFTAEGALDFQTPRGKIPAEVAQRAKKFKLPVVALAGTLGEGVELNLEHGIDAYESILRQPSSLDEAVQDAAVLLTNAAEQEMRLIMIGVNLSHSSQGEA